MAQVKIYPSTQAQVQAVQNTVDEINLKIVTPTYQAKIVTPTTAQQLVEPDSGYDALSSVTVNPAQTTDLDNWISRNDQQEPIYLELTIDEIASYACYGQLRLVSFKGDNVTFVGSNAFYNCTSLQTIDFRNVTSIGNSAFQGCTSLQTIDLRNVTSIGGSAFNNCPSLQTIDLRNATSIGVSAFQGCTSLQTIDLRNVTSIGNSAFYGCTSLQTIDIRNATSIGGYVFQLCKSLQLIDCTSCATPPTIQTHNFDGTDYNFKVVVATDAEKTLFQAATNWSSIASRIYTIAEIEAIVGMTYDEYYLQCFGHARFD